MRPETRRFIFDVCIAVSAVVVIFVTILSLVYIITDVEIDFDDIDDSDVQPTCNPQVESLQEMCDMTTSTYRLVETIPYGEFNQTILTPYQSTAEAWEDLIQNAEQTLYISCGYFTLNYTGDGDYNETLWDNQGHDVGLYIYQLLIDASNRGVEIHVVENAPGSVDSIRLATQGVITLRLVDINSLTGNGGILHSKFIIADEKRFYLGSANMDWRSLTQVKELGILVDSECLTKDFVQIWRIYWESGIMSHVPETQLTTYTEVGLFISECNVTQYNSYVETKPVTMWPIITQAYFNETLPAHLTLLDLSETKSKSWLSARDEINDTQSDYVYISSVPESYCSPYRSNDLKSMLRILNEAQASISISVMYYSPSTLYTESVTYWGVLDNAIRQAALDRGVKVRLMVTDWTSTIDLTPFWKSLDALENVEVRVFVIPPLPDVEIPYARVNHAKFLVTEREVALTTSNWSADYFLSTLGVSFITNQRSVISEVRDLFERDWNSPYCNKLDVCN